LAPHPGHALDMAAQFDFLGQQRIAGLAVRGVFVRKMRVVAFGQCLGRGQCGRLRHRLAS